MEEIFRKHKVFIISSLVLSIMLLLNFLNSGSPGGADTYMHFLFAKWAFVHPELLFNHWGKPMFTIFSAPFAQFGFKGSVTFNILLAISSGYLVYKSANKLNIKHAWLGIIFTVFTPVFFLISFSSLTEIIFAFLIILSVYFFITKRYYLSVIVMSFIPFARTEGIIFFPLITLGLLLLKQYKQIPFLFVGFIVMSVAGYPIYHDLLWPITKNPYHDSSALYGNGSLLHFINHSTQLFGWPIIILFFGGAFLGLKTAIKEGINHNSIVILILLSISIGYFSAHSFVWAFGMGGSAGLTRVMAGVAPVIALIALFGYNFIAQKFHNKTPLKIFTVIIILVVVIEGTTKHQFPISVGSEEKVLRESSNFIIENNLNNNYIVYYNPVNAYILGLDHFTTHKSKDGVYDPKSPEKNLPLGTIIIWDAHFGPNEGRLPKQSLDTHPEFKVLKVFKPKEAFKVRNNQDYEVIIYQKVKSLNNK